MNLEPFKYFQALHSRSKSDVIFNKTSKKNLKDYFFESVQMQNKEFVLLKNN